MRPVAFGEALPPGTGLTAFSDDKPDRFFTAINFSMDETSGVALALRTGVPSYQVEAGLPRRRLCGGGRKAEFIYQFISQLRKMETEHFVVPGLRVMVFKAHYLVSAGVTFEHSIRIFQSSPLANY